MFHNMTQKKRDCTAAVPHFEALELPLTLNKQHRSPRRYVRICTHFKLVCTTRIYISRGHQNAAMSWSYLEFSRFRNAKNKARYDAFIMSVTTHPKDIIPRRGRITSAKVLQKLQVCKKIAKKSLFFR